MVELLVLGPIGARDGDEVIGLGSRGQRAIVASLVHARGNAVAVDELVDLVWGDDLPGDPRAALKSHVSRLRRVVGADIVRAYPRGYALTEAAGGLDVARFERGLAPGAALTDVDAALALWRGQPYGEFADHPYFAGDVARLEELHVQGRIRRADLLLRAGSTGDAAAVYTELVVEQPLREAAWVGMVRALHADDRLAEATAQARRYRELTRDAGLDPSPRFVEVEHEVFATASTPVPRRRRASSLPAPLSSLVGRERELPELTGLLADRRLVTLTGPGGVGKTTLALHASRQLGDELTDGGWFVALEEIHDPGSVVPALIRAVGAPARQPLGRALEHFFAGQHALLVVDNAEHVHDEVRRVVTRLLAVAGDLHVLVTSRQPLDVPGEAVVPVAPLRLPAAVALLRERARDAGVPIAAGEEALAAELCERLDRLPLAIEMAAARLRGLGLADLAGRLDEGLRLLGAADRGRHETMAAVVAWSYELLDPSSRSLLDQLSVFAGSFDMDAVEAVGDGADLARAVVDLVDRSLVQRVDGVSPARFRLYGAVRAFAGERLAAHGEHHDTVRRFVRHHAALARRIDSGLRGPDEHHWARLVEVQLPNLEAAHEHALRLGDLDAAVELVVGLYVFTYQRLRGDVGAWAEATLPVAAEAGHPRVAGVAAVAALNLLLRGDFDGAADLLTDLPDDPSARYVSEVLGDLHNYRGEFDTSYAHFRRAERQARRVDDRFTLLYSRLNQAIVLGYRGQLDAALEAVREVRAEAVLARIHLVTAWCDFATAELMAERDPDQALELIDRTVLQADRAGWTMLAGVGRLTASSLRARTVDPQAAVPGFVRLVRHWARVGDETHQWTTLRNLVDLFIRLGADAPAARLLGAVGAAPRPTFGAEQERLEVARATVRVRLGTGADELHRAGREDGINGAVEHALDALERLRRDAAEGGAVS